MTKIALIGAAGRMGREIINIIEKDDSLVLAAATERRGSPAVGTIIGDVRVGDDILSACESADVIIDFSGAEGTYNNITSYRKAKKPLVVGSTGLTSAQSEELFTLANEIPLFVSSNMSLGVGLMARLVYLAAKALDSDYNIEIFEAHHKHKKDAPSGTALTLGEAAARGRELSFKASAVYAREGMTGERGADEIGFQILRGGDIVGEHTVFFCGEGERLEITHRATSRSIFAQGAVKASVWLKGRPVGRYDMNDFLGTAE